MASFVKSLKVRCAEAGTTLAEVCRRSGVSRTTVDRWEHKEPLTFRLREKLEQAVNEIAEQRKQAEATPTE